MTELRNIVTRAREAAEAGDLGGAWALLEARREALGEDPAFAWAWLVLGANDPDRGVERADLETILDAWWNHPDIVISGVEQLLAPVDGRPADEPIPGDDPTGFAMDILGECLDELLEQDPDAAANPEVGGQLWNSLGNACRLAGPDHDEDAELAYEAALETDPERAWWRFNLGLLYKHRGRWEEGVAQNRRVREEVGDERPVLWNLGICATGAGDGETAAAAWRALGLEVTDATPGTRGLPGVPDLGELIVRVSTGGIGAGHRGAGGVDFEHVWVSPLSPCHGHVISATLHPVGVDYGDVVLWDGAPIGQREVDGRTVPRFPALARLWRGDARTFPFVAQQDHEGQLTTLGASLPDPCRLYVFEDQLEWLCEHCIRTGGPHEDDHPSPSPADDSGRVFGKLIYDPRCGAPLADVAAQLRALLHDAKLTIAVPELHRALGDELSTQRHEHRWKQM